MAPLVLLSRFSLSAKLIVAFFLVTIPSLAAMGAIGLYALWGLTNVNRDLQEISRAMDAVQGLETAVAETETVLSASLIHGSLGQDERFKAAIQEVDGRTRGGAPSV